MEDIEKMKEEFFKEIHKAQERDKAKRKEIIDLLGQLVEDHPEERVGQIIFNFICAQTPRQDPFFISDTDLLEILKNAIK